MWVLSQGFSDWKYPPIRKKLVFSSISFEISMLKSPAIKMLSYLFTTWPRVFDTSSKNDLWGGVEKS